MIRTAWAAAGILRVQILATIWSCLMRWRLTLAGAQVGPRLTVRGWIDLRIERRAVVRVGSDCRINSGFAANAVGGFRRTGIWVTNRGCLMIGRNVGISNCTIVCAERVTIGDDVFIGGDCGIYDTDFHSIAPDLRLARPDTTVKTAPIAIGPRSFIGAHTLILKGVAIGEEAVIGAGSVVTKDVPPREIWAGNPAMPIGRVSH